MKKYLLAGCLLMAGPTYAAHTPGQPCAAHAPGLTRPAGDSTQLPQMIQVYFDGVAAKDFVKLRSMTTADFVIYEDGKVWNNDSVFRNIQYHQPFSVKFVLSDIRVFEDTHSAYATYLSHPDFVLSDGVKFHLDFIETMIFRKTAGGWKISTLHITELKSPEVDMPSRYRKYDTVRFVPEHYQERIATFRSEPVQQGGTVLLGNSITEFGDWRRLLNDAGVLNRGIAGDNTFGMLDRLQEIIGRHPSKLFIEAGINDIAQGVPAEMIVGNISSIVQWVKAGSPGTKVYVVSVLPTNENVQKEYPELIGKNPVVREVDRQLLQQAGPVGFTYIDLAARVADPSGNLLAKFARKDGLHLNGEGYKVFAGLISPR
jgi:lysophospholipase L1-like esterase/ketosteroid isomerase-like protein